MRGYNATMNLDGPAERIANVQESDVEYTPGNNAMTFNPLRETSLQTVGWLLAIYAEAGNSGSVAVVLAEATQLLVDDVLAQATTVLNAGENVKVFLPGGADTSFLAQLAGSAASQGVRIELWEVKERR
jgi:hypothetical protein